MLTGHFRMLIFILKMLFLFAKCQNAIKINLAYPSTKNFNSLYFYIYICQNAHFFKRRSHIQLGIVQAKKIAVDFQSVQLFEVLHFR